MDIKVLISIVVAVASVIVIILSYFYDLLKKRKKEKESKQRDIYNSKVAEVFWSKYKELLPSAPIKFSEYFRTYYERTLRNIIVHSPTSLTESQVENEINKKFDEIDVRLKEIEKRFPEESTLEKIASINDAILATNIETLSESIKRIEDKLFTKWDVAKITFQILGGLGVLIGIIFAIINFVS